MRSSNESPHELSLEIALQFVLSNLSLIGVQCDITPEQIWTDRYKWPERLRVYNFHYNAMLFRPFAKFLRHIFKVILNKQQIFDSSANSVSHSSESSLPKSPIFYLLELLGVWHKVYTDLEKQECNLVSLCFEEPLARISKLTFCKNFVYCFLNYCPLNFRILFPCVFLYSTISLYLFIFYFHL